MASVNPLVPKPGTTYQWLPMTDATVIDRKIDELRTLVSGVDNVYFNIKSERHSYYQALLSLGDRRVAPVIVEQSGTRLVLTEYGPKSRAAAVPPKGAMR